MNHSLKPPHNSRHDHVRHLLGMVVRQWLVQYQRIKPHDRPFLLVGGSFPNGEQLTNGKTCSAGGRSTQMKVW